MDGLAAILRSWGIDGVETNVSSARRPHRGLMESLGRRDIERRLDALVQDNRPTIAITFPLVGVALMILGIEGVLPEWVAFNPYLMVLAVAVMALPLVGGLAPLVDRRLAVGIGVLVVFTLGIELVGVHTGLPYGEFEYERALGPMLLGDVPVFLPVFFFPILLNSYLFTLLWLGRDASLLARYLGTVAVVLTLDLVLDPGAVALEFWGWFDGGIYYGVPVQNYLGWLVSASVAVAVLTLALDQEAVFDRLETCEYFLDDLISFGIFWGLVNAYVLNLVPFAIALVVLGTLFVLEWYDFAGLGVQRLVDVARR